MKIEVRESRQLWMFPDSWPEKGAILEFVEAKKEDKGQVLYFMGKTPDAIGDFKVWPGKIKNLKLIIDALGDDDTKWQGKKFLAKVKDKAFIFEML